MSKFYAQLNASNIVLSVSQLCFAQGFTLPADLVEVLNLDADLLGKKYEGGEFVVVPVVVVPVRGITIGAMRSRFTLAEKVAIKDSVDSVVQVLAEDMNNSEFIDLDNAELIYGLTYLTDTALILAAGRMAELLVDGLENEKF
jgi:hypothetical protein